MNKLFKDYQSGGPFSFALKVYFDRQPPLKPFETDYSKMEEIGYRDTDGYLVLPAEERN